VFFNILKRLEMVPDNLEHVDDELLQLATKITVLTISQEPNHRFL